MLQQLLDWINVERKRAHSPNRLARWLGAAWARVSYAYHVEPGWLEINRITVSIDDWPDRLSGLRIVQLSDFHCGRRITGDVIANAAEAAMQLRPDLIALTGDFVHAGFHFVDEAAEALKDLSAPLGVWAVLGNHDYSVRNALGRRKYPTLCDAVARALEKYDVHVLENESRQVEKDGESFYVTGLADLWSRAFDPVTAMKNLDAAAPRIILAHNPMSIEMLDGRRCDLMLSGHTHGGQINLKNHGRIGLGKNGKRYAAGLYQTPAGTLYVNRGIGVGSFPLRYNVRPEITLLELT